MQFEIQNSIPQRISLPPPRTQSPGLQKDVPDNRSFRKSQQIKLKQSRNKVKNRFKRTIQQLCNKIVNQLNQKVDCLEQQQFQTLQKGIQKMCYQILQSVDNWLKGDILRKKLLQQTKNTIQSYAQKKMLSRDFHTKLNETQQISMNLKQTNSSLRTNQMKKTRLQNQSFNFTFSAPLSMRQHTYTNKQNKQTYRQFKQRGLQKQKPIMTFSQYKKML